MHNNYAVSCRFSLACSVHTEMIRRTEEVLKTSEQRLVETKVLLETSEESLTYEAIYPTLAPRWSGLQWLPK